ACAPVAAPAAAHGGNPSHQRSQKVDGDVCLGHFFRSTRNLRRWDLAFTITTTHTAYTQHIHLSRLCTIHSNSNNNNEATKCLHSGDQRGGCRQDGGDTVLGRGRSSCE